MPDTDLEARFNRRLLELLDAAREHAPFLAVRNVVPPREEEALRWVRNVLAAPHPSDATAELWAAGYTALTVEALVLDDPWAALFTSAEREVARRRLGLAPRADATDGPPVALEARFHRRMLAIHEAARRDVHYDAARFRALVEARGGVEAARAVLAEPALAGGLAELALAGRADLSVEALVLEEPFCALFTAAELANARERLGR